MRRGEVGNQLELNPGLATRALSDFVADALVDLKNKNQIGLLSFHQVNAITDLGVQEAAIDIERFECRGVALGRFFVISAGAE